jgi:hypothetical protein
MTITLLDFDLNDGQADITIGLRRGDINGRVIVTVPYAELAGKPQADQVKRIIGALRALGFQGPRPELDREFVGLVGTSLPWKG